MKEEGGLMLMRVFDLHTSKLRHNNITSCTNTVE